jgi:hypothetical protein
LNVKKIENEDLEDSVKGKEFEVKDAEKKLEMILSAAAGSLDAPSSIAGATQLEKISFSVGAGGVCIILQVLSFTNGVFNQIKEEVVHIDEVEGLRKVDSHARESAGTKLSKHYNNFRAVAETLPRSVPSSFQRIEGGAYKVWVAQASKVTYAPILKAYFFQWRDYQAAFKELRAFEVRSLGK